MKINQVDLEQALKMINNQMPANNQLELDWAFGGVRLMDGNGNDIAPRGSKRETYYYMVCFSRGMDQLKRSVESLGLNFKNASGREVVQAIRAQS